MSLHFNKPKKHVVLYAENDDTDLVICEHAFRPHEDKIQFRTVGDGDGVIAWLEGRGSYGNRAFFPLPGVLVLDSKLGDMSGLDVLRWVRGRDRFKELPVVLHVGSTPEHELHEYHGLGIAACVEKQANPTNLIDCVF